MRIGPILFVISLSLGLALADETDLRHAVEALAFSSSSSVFTTVNGDVADDDESEHPSTDTSQPAVAPANGKCEEITVPMCRNMEYNLTSMPNQFNHESQQEAAAEAHQFWALVEINCAKELRFFLCSMYTPICLPNYAQPIRACKSVCVRARLGCEKYMKKFGFEWPEHMHCDLFPEYGSSNQVCMDPMDAQFQTTHASKKLNINHNLATVGAASESSAVSPKPVLVSPQINLFGIEERPSLLDTLCVHPFVKQPKQTVGGLASCMYCTPSTSLPYFDAHDKELAYYWLLVCAVLCLVSSLGTTLTFLLQRDRFKYPEKPVIYLSICYALVSLGYLVKLVSSSSYSSSTHCDAASSSTPGLTCTFTFALIYYFGMASAAWWTIGAFVWFLAAARQWSSEALARHNRHFHACAWLLPFAQTLAALCWSRGLSPDSLAGMCRITDADDDLWLQLTPTCLYLALGVTFLAGGFVSLGRVRPPLKASTQLRGGVHKLDKLMVRVGVFSVLYTVPAACVLACHLYERASRAQWERNILCTNANVALPTSSSFSDEEIREFCTMSGRVTPALALFLLKYLMSLIVGVTAGFWIWSGKTWRLLVAFLSPKHHADHLSSASSSSTNGTRTTGVSDVDSSTTTISSRFCCCFKSASTTVKSSCETSSHKNSVVYLPAASDELHSKPVHHFYDAHVLVDDHVIYQKWHASSATSTPMHLLQHQTTQYGHYNKSAANNANMYGLARIEDVREESQQSKPSAGHAVIYCDYGGTVPLVDEDTNTMSSKSYSVPVSIASLRK